MTSSISGVAAIAGVGETDFSSRSGRTPIQLAVQASLRAIADAGLAPGDIDGIIPFRLGPTTEDMIAALGLADVRFTAVLHLGGASPVAAIRVAALALAAGEANAILMYVSRNGRSGPRADVRAAQQLPGISFRRGLELPIGLSTPAQWYALMAQRHMYEFGTSRDQLGRVAITMREHAQRNPAAQMYGRPLTMEMYHESRLIADPYRLYDCSLETDGASAIVLTSSARARDLRHRPVLIRGVGEGHSDSADDIASREPIYSTGLARAAPRALAAAGVVHSDIDVALIYDCFTFEVIQQLEEAGFVARGEGGPFVEDGHISVAGGSLPVNPHGGLLSAGHVAGMNHIVEAAYQLRGTAGEHQVEDAELVAVTGWGDFGDGSMAILSC
jgi:acetyl-CoA acetyltransferase